MKWWTRLNYSLQEQPKRELTYWRAELKKSERKKKNMIDPQKRYGFVRDVEADLLDELALTIKREWGEMRFLEVGVFGGGTVSGLVRRCQAIECPIYAAGVDFEQWKPQPAPLPDYEFHAGDSMEQWRDITKRFNFLFVDGCHCVIHAMCDFLNYSQFVDVGGYVLFHDTGLPDGKHDQEPWPQDHSYAGVNNSKLGVREALHKLGLLQGYRKDWELVKELESNTGLMGMVLLRKLQ